MTSLFNALADNLWDISHPLVIGPVVLDHRMSVVRLSSGALWVHSPVRLDQGIRAALDQLGEVAYLVAPSIFHDLYWEEWFAAYPEARFFAAPGVRQQHPELPFTDELADETPAAWRDDLQQLVLGGVPRLNETVFLHRPSRTLIVADLVFNFTGYEPRLNLATALTLKVAGTYGRLGVSRFFRMLVKDPKALRHSLDQLLSWDFERLVVGHGRNVERHARPVLEQACRFLKA
jgi:hypothetical protein